ncbi:hypothetical protein [Clostridium sardiniense]|uniref:hypothetical protein n=1 Tax=Clostridium sardiniense TaxID=29369 RepID=UPI003D3329C1
MNRLRDMYESYIDELDKEGAIEEAVDYEDYAYMYSLHLRRYGFNTNDEEGINEALDENYRLLHLDFEEIRESGIYVAPMTSELPLFNIKEAINESNCDLECFNVTSMENSKEYIETYSGIVDIDLNKIISGKSSLRVKDGYRLILYRIKNNFEDKYRLHAFRGYGMIPMPSQDNLIDTYFEGVDLELNQMEDSFMNAIKGDKTPNSYMEAILLFNEITELETGNLSDIVLYGENRYINNRFIPKEPMLYQVNNQKIIEYYAYVQDESRELDTFSKNIVLFEDGDYSLKMAKMIEGSVKN